MFGRLTGWRRVETRNDRTPKVLFSAMARATIVMVWL